MVNALINCQSGDVWLGRNVSFGHNVSIITGTHDIVRFGHERKATVPATGRDIVIDEGAWIASNATIIGPCHVGSHAVVAAGAVVLHDVPPYAIVVGVPARVISVIAH
jgi:acetyltransferase-like isoleucine patch superfamily enzyme